jgi:hypothetical protein
MHKEYNWDNPEDYINGGENLDDLWDDCGEGVTIVNG